MPIEESVRIFCTNMRQIRSMYRLSKKEMAQITGISVKSITMIENGQIPSRVSCNVLFKIYERFEIHPKDMLSPNMKEK